MSKDKERKGISLSLSRVKKIFFGATGNTPYNGASNETYNVYDGSVYEYTVKKHHDDTK